MRGEKNSGHVGHTWTGQCSPQHVRTRFTRLRGLEGNGVQPEDDVHGGGWQHAQKHSEHWHTCHVCFGDLSDMRSGRVSLTQLNTKVSYTDVMEYAMRMGDRGT